jgi:hypothetical protein
MALGITQQAEAISKGLFYVNRQHTQKEQPPKRLLV